MRLRGSVQSACATIGRVEPYSYVRQWHSQLLSKGWWHSFELPDGSLIEGVSDLAAQKRRLAQFPIPDDLRGKRVLDVGAWDGWFSFEMERRGAEVTAIDCVEVKNFQTIRAALGSRMSVHYTTGLGWFHGEFVPRLKHTLRDLSGGTWDLTDFDAFAAGSDVDFMAHLIEAVAAREEVRLYPGDWFGFRVGCTRVLHLRSRCFLPCSL